MRDFLLYAAVIILAGLGAYYILGEVGLLVPLMALFGLGSGEVISQSNAIKELDAKAERVKTKLEEIKKEQEKLDKEGVKELSDKEETEYWKNQKL